MVKDIIPELKIAIQELRSAGFSAEASELESKISTAYTTSSELLGDIGISIKSILKNIGSKLPNKTKRKLESCSIQVSKVWPDLHY
jgi:hypothetical protein